MDDVAEFFFQVICYGTGRLLIRVVPFIDLKMLPKGVKPKVTRFWGEHMFQRLPQGGVGVSAEGAALIGLIFWALVGAAVAVWLIWRS
jgi:hypothetical protein